MERWTSTICCMRYLDLLTQSWSISNQTYTVGRTFTWRNLEFTDTKMIDFKSDLHRWAGLLRDETWNLLTQILEKSENFPIFFGQVFLRCTDFDHLFSKTTSRFHFFTFWNYWFYLRGLMMFFEIWSGFRGPSTIPLRGKHVLEKWKTFLSWGISIFWQKKHFFQLF